MRRPARAGHRRPARPVLAAFGLAIGLVASGCGPTPSVPQGAVAEPELEPPTTARPEGRPSPSPAELGVTASAAEVRARGMSLGVGAPGQRGTRAPVGGVFWSPFSVVSLTHEDLRGTSRYTVTVEREASDRTTIALFAAPEGAAFEVLLDGSAVARDAAGVALAGLPAPLGKGGAARSMARYETVGTDLLRLVDVAPPTDEEDEASPREVSFWPSDAAVTSLVWGDREGGLSLAVTPDEWARSAGKAGVEVVWSQVVESEPDADVPGMYDQLACHALGAPDKDTWNLEPWRPAVGLLQTLAARCNP